jgi:hypothetical protein
VNSADHILASAVSHNVVRELTPQVAVAAVFVGAD